MRARHTLKVVVGTVVATVLMGFLLTGSPAGAQEDEYANVLNTVVDRPTVGASCNNSDITVTTSNLQPGTEATFTLYSDPVVLGTVTVADDGTATLVFDLPAGTTVGQHELVTTGTNNEGNPDEETIVLTVTSCAPTDGDIDGDGDGNGSGNGSGSGDLARTGTDVSTPIRAAVVVFAAGAALLLVSRKRQTRSA